ncbi:ankyrin-1-like [Trichogramma pretiosum]|uniref:ankyrin-1-like n=1 Tax=Trichogramma pretiosum TaxID=7493 RepID=UPI0006C9AB08|nr:ankyrin-1-like [Trichogramma pretiosum]
MDQLSKNNVIDEKLDLPLPKIEQILKANINSEKGKSTDIECLSLIERMILMNYNDDLKFDQEGKPILRRTTAVHFVARRDLPLESPKIQALFRVYDRFEANYVDETGLSHFHVACRYGFHDVVERFIEAGQSPDFRPLQTIDPPLHLALHHGHWTTAELLLSRGRADPTATSRDGLTALHVLSQNRECDMDLAQTLLQGGLDVRVDAWDRWGNTPLHLALHHGNAKMVELLLRHGSNPNFVNNAGMSPLHVISRRDRHGHLAELFFGVADEMHLSVWVDAQDNEGNTPLHCALQRGLKRVVVLLLQRGAEPNLACADGGNCLHILCRQQYDGELIDAFFEVINDRRQLMEVNARDKQGDTPLHLALRRDDVAMAELLLRSGADSLLANNEGDTPLLMMSRNYDECRDLLDILSGLTLNQPPTLQVDVVGSSAITVTSTVV